MKRLLIYSHDSWGLGHLRRSLAISSAVTQRYPGSNVLVVTGSPCATQFDLPDRCDVLKLPAVSKDAEGSYVPRTLSGDISRTIDLRSRIILEAYHSFDPQVIIVDHQPTGLLHEALPMLREANAMGRHLIYGMRDVLDAPDKVSAGWNSRQHHWALHEAYDRICVYGTPEVFDPREQYPLLKQLLGKITFTGYVVTPTLMSARQPVPSIRKKVIVTMGGGEDGGQRIEAYLRSLLISPADWDSHIVTGPLMDRSRVRHLKRMIHQHALLDRVRISRFYLDLPRLLREADATVGMAGYNSCVEMLQSGVPSVLLPRSFPRSEQLIRARQLASLGLASCVEEFTPENIRSAVEVALATGFDPTRRPALNGLDKLGEVIEELLNPSYEVQQRLLASR